MLGDTISCPKCQYLRTAADARMMAGVCPSCGIVYDKWKPTDQVTEQPKEINQKTQSDSENGIQPQLVQSLSSRLKSALFYIPESVDGTSFYGRCIVLALFFIWGWSFILTGLDRQFIMGSFMHNINLPFHEFGHVLFSPLGRFLTILGGSLFQILLPIGLTFVFVYRQQDTFAGSITLWWTGQSFIDLSPYIADATHRSLPLVGGMGKEGHDWGNLFGMMDMLSYDSAIARLSFTTGAIIILISLAWGAYLLYLQKSRL